MPQLFPLLYLLDDDVVLVATVHLFVAFVRCLPICCLQKQIHRRKRVVYFLNGTREWRLLHPCCLVIHAVYFSPGCVVMWPYSATDKQMFPFGMTNSIRFWENVYLHTEIWSYIRPFWTIYIHLLVPLHLLLPRPSPPTRFSTGHFGHGEVHILVMAVNMAPWLLRFTCTSISTFDCYRQGNISFISCQIFRLHVFRVL